MHCRIDLRLSKGAISLSSVAQSLEQRLCAVVEILPKFRQRTLGHFVDRQLTGEISADSYELDQGRA